MVVFLRFIMLTKGLVAAVIWMVTGVLERCRWGVASVFRSPSKIRGVATLFGVVSRVLQGHCPQCLGLLRGCLVFSCWWVRRWLLFKMVAW